MKLKICPECYFSCQYISLSLKAWMSTLMSWMCGAFTSLSYSWMWTLDSLMTSSACFSWKVTNNTEPNEEVVLGNWSARLQDMQTCNRLQNSWHTLQNVGTFLMNVALQLKKIPFAKFPPPPNQCWSLFPALWSFRVWSTLCRGEGGSFT